MDARQHPFYAFDVDGAPKCYQAADSRKNAVERCDIHDLRVILCGREPYLQPLQVDVRHYAEARLRRLERAAKTQSALTEV